VVSKRVGWSDPLYWKVSDEENLEAAGSLVILYFGNDWFAENRTSSHHMAERLSRRAPLLYIDCPGIRSPKATARDWRKLWRKLAAALERPRKVGENLWHVTLPQIPFRRLPLVDKLNLLAGRLLLKRALRRLGSRESISWFVVPHPGGLAGKLGENFIVYYCIDDYASFPGMDVETIQRLDDELTRKADQVFASSARLVERKKGVAKRLAFSPHGVDAELFGQAASPATAVHAVAAGLRHPVIGFFGVLGDWINIELLQYLAEQRPDWTFLLIGMISTAIGNLAEMPNVVLPGPQPYRTLPGWAKAFDVAIIPYRQNRQVLNASPLKVREYLATGKSVVSVWTPDIEQFAGHVRIGNTPEEFLGEIERALADDSEESRRQRMAAVAPHTWDARAAAVWKTVEEAIASGH
jgi:glycosyltransferase involved in cell wall biosynthesis